MKKLVVVLGVVGILLSILGLFFLVMNGAAVNSLTQKELKTALTDLGLEEGSPVTQRIQTVAGTLKMYGDKLPVNTEVEMIADETMPTLLEVMNKLGLKEGGVSKTEVMSVINSLVREREKATDSDGNPWPTFSAWDIAQTWLTQRPWIFVVVGIACIVLSFVVDKRAEEKEYERAIERSKRGKAWVCANCGTTNGRNRVSCTACGTVSPKA